MLTAYFDKSATRYMEVRALLKQNDVLGIEHLAARMGRDIIVQLVDKTLAATLTPAMASVISGPDGVVAQGKGEVSDMGEVAQPTAYLQLLTVLLQARNIPALDVILRKEKNHFNGWQGTEVLTRIVDAPIAGEDKLRFLSAVLEGGHDRMTFPARAALKAASSNMNAVLELFAGFELKQQRPPLKLRQPEPDRR